MVCDLTFLGVGLCRFLSSWLCLKPVHDGGQAENTQEGVAGLLACDRHGASFLQPVPEIFDPVAVDLYPGETGDRHLAAFERDRRAGVGVPDEFAKGTRGIATIAGDPQRDGDEHGQQQWRQQQFVRPLQSKGKAGGMTGRIHDRAGFGGKAITKAAKFFIRVALGRRPSVLGGTRSFAVRSDIGVVEKGRPQFYATSRPFQQTFSDAVASPRTEDLLCHPLWAQSGRNALPRRTFLVSPDDRRDGSAQFVMPGLVGRPPRLDVWLQRRPLFVRQGSVLNATRHPLNMGPNSRIDRVSWN
jgi:hypothetical protein